MKKFCSYAIISLTFAVQHVSADTAEIQRMLNLLGFEAGIADGIYGKKTKNALIRYYTSKNSTYDGNLDENEFNDPVAGSLSACSTAASSVASSAGSAGTRGYCRPSLVFGWLAWAGSSTGDFTPGSVTSGLETACLETACFEITASAAACGCFGLSQSPVSRLAVMAETASTLRLRMVGQGRCADPTGAVQAARKVLRS